MNHPAGVFKPLQDDDPRTVAGYRLAARLGAGGMGRVYLSHTRGGRPVAVKVVRSELADDPAFRRRFGREIGAARKVKGAYTAELIDADPDAAPPWLATLYVPGPSLSDVVARGGPLPVPAVLWLMAGVAEALQAIHGAGIVHRDLKPANVLLAADGPRVIDFGISLAADSTAHTATGSTIGTPQYMAPEQASAGDITAATDIFALGQTAAFAALGSPLYGDGPAATVLYRIVHSEPDLSGVPERLRDLLARCLAADPGERATPTEVVEWCRRELGRDGGEEAGPALWREIAGPPVTVPPPAAATGPATAAAPVAAPGPTAVHTTPWTVPQPAAPPQGAVPAPWQAVPGPWPGAVGPGGPTVPRRPAGPEERRRRRRNTVLISVGAVVACGLVIAAGSALLDAAGRGIERVRDAAASESASAAAESASGAPRPVAEGSPADGEAGASGASAGPGAAPSADTSDTGAEGAGAGTRAPAAHVYYAPMLKGDNSLILHNGKERKDRKGDVRFGCESAGCELTSDTSVMVHNVRGPGATYETCRQLTSGPEAPRELLLADKAAGSEICVKHRNGDIALMVIEVKSTALPDIGFLTTDLTVWPAEKD
ncbi:serine/threonine protein kinase [Streptomyces sp. BK208]|uniref:serine/threonine-protein kinase n=1 Tax=Streptomyces sp. BK208 TaxID=2512150 RepID=UPI00105C9C4F|nr:serine/threonine-protein kinase [Streptomyces sp. BK208]TDT32240.1 serine/threonine protein kinase [Streptomyces sp. BK208]